MSVMNFAASKKKEDEVLTTIEFGETFACTRQVSIMATITRTTCDLATMEKMILAGLNVVRFKCSYDSHEFQKEMMDTINQAVENVSTQLEYNTCVAVGLDIQGKEIRTGYLESSNDLELKRNETIRLTSNPEFATRSTKENIYVDYPDIMKAVKYDTKIYINGGAIKLIVRELGTDSVICTVLEGGPLGPRRGIQILGADVNITGITVRDREHLKFAVERNMDAVFVSRTRTAAQLREIRNYMGPNGKNIRIIAKIDNAQAVRNIDEIMEAANGVLIVRRKLRVELSSAQIVRAQKVIIARCNIAHCPVYVGTQMVRSMLTKHRPSRSETLDIGNTVMDGVDGIMLSVETVYGIHPVETIAALSEILTQIEGGIKYFNKTDEIVAASLPVVDRTHGTAMAVAQCVKNAEAKLVIVLTNSGRMACLVSLYRPMCPIIAISRCPKTIQLTLFHRGVIPIIYTVPPKEKWSEEKFERIQFGMEIARKLNIIKNEDPLVSVSHFNEDDPFPSCVEVSYAVLSPELEEVTKRGSRGSILSRTTIG